MAVKVLDFVSSIDGDVMVRLVGQTDVEIQKLAESIVLREWEGEEDLLMEEYYMNPTPDWLQALHETVSYYGLQYEFHDQTFEVGYSFYSYDKLADYR